jgi:hypothetical protein
MLSVQTKGKALNLLLYLHTTYSHLYLPMTHMNASNEVVKTGTIFKVKYAIYNLT